jgi:catechol 2,3-dioxygenase-like lactoylglutathione lyase family enzyme
MAVEFNHTIVPVRDKLAAATFLTDLFGLPAPTPVHTFLAVTLSNGVSLDFMDVSDDIQPQHYAFLVSEDEFDVIFDRVRERGIGYRADPYHQQPDEIYTRDDGGRGFYFDDPNGHILELLTPPHGNGSAD